MQSKINFKNVSKSFGKKSNHIFLSKKARVSNSVVLDSINLEFCSGQRIGVFGKNGSGKTTLLRLIAGITSPTSGLVEVEGKVVSLMELNAGFNLELSGRDNIVLNGMILGISKKDILKKIDKIISFSELGEKIDSPFFTYSDGMKFRLAFSVAIESRANIILMDEVFAAGDIDFQYKTFAKIKSIQKTRKNLITVICSHVPTIIRSFADSYYEVENGNIKQVHVEEVDKIIREIRKKWFNLYK